MPSKTTIRVATMRGLAAMLVMLFCILLLANHARAHQQPQSAASGSAASPPSCIPHERDALLAFKHGVTSDPAGLLNSWRRDGGDGEQDCCRWRSVRCSNLTGHVLELRLRGNYYEEPAMEGKISPSLLALDHLEHLDLSRNDLAGPTGRLPKFLGSLKNLKYLDLSGIPFHSGLLPQLGNLSKLQYLDLSTYYPGSTKSTDLSWLTLLPSIQYLKLNGVHLSTVADWPRVMNMLPTLRVLHLSNCFLVSANQSLAYMNLTNLEELDLSLNFFDHPMATSWFWNITNLKYLYLNETNLYGQFPDALGDMASLKVLDLSNFPYYYKNGDERNYRMMTTDLKSLCNLEVLNLYNSFLHGDITELFRNLPRCSPNKLQELNLGWNQLTGMLPRWIGQLTSLVTLNLGSNNISGPVPASAGQFAGLQTLDFSHNNLNGSVPYEIGMLGNLTLLDLNSNKLDGMIRGEHFASLRSLQYIDLSHNALKFELRSDWKPPFILDTAYFAACNLGPLFPGWLQWLVNITHLDISSAGIYGRLPQWFSDAFSNVEYLNIANNQLNGSLPKIMGFVSLQELYLNSNQLSGPIPRLPVNITIVDLSNNFLSGPLPTPTGSVKLLCLVLFSNQITGHIPKSYCEYQMLEVLDLSNNFLEGQLPSCLGVMEHMEYLAIGNNSLSGEFPSFLQNFTNMKVLDLARNNFFGRLPMWINKFRSLTIVQLNHNNFFGNIPATITNTACLRCLDLNNNGISGSLPSYLSNMGAMRKTDFKIECFVPDIYLFRLTSLSTVWKGQELNYGSIKRVLDTRMTSIDLSSNNLTGEIPEEIVVLDALVNLNLSRNHLTGVIPEKIGEMQSLQSLDLSRNKLSEEIPVTMSDLTFLSDLDLSYNNLTGRIPSGTQLDTLYAEDPSMYIGNAGLCGHPLPNSCLNEGHAPKEGVLERTEEDQGIQFFYLGLECGFVVGTWMAFGVLLFKRSWRIACFRFLDKLCDRVYVHVTVRMGKTNKN